MLNSSNQKREVKWRGRLWPFLGGVIALLLFAEFVLRFVVGLHAPLLFQNDLHAGYIPVPEQDARRFDSRIIINQFGMRSGDVSLAPKADETRILFIGDSVTFGPAYVDQADIFATLVPAELEKEGLGDWESLNGSAPGWATHNELGFLKSRGAFGSKVVVLVTNTGDLSQPFAQLGAHYATERPPFALWEAVYRHVLPKIGLRAHTVDAGSTGELTNSIPVSEVIANIAKFKQATESAGAHFILAYVPATAPGWSAEHWKREKRALDEWVDASNVSYVDVSKAMAREHSEHMYFDGVHLRPAGHRVVAREIKAALTAWHRAKSGS